MERERNLARARERKKERDLDRETDRDIGRDWHAENESGGAGVRGRRRRGRRLVLDRRRRD